MSLEQVEGKYADQKVIEDLTKLSAILKLAIENPQVKKFGARLKKEDNIWTGAESWFGFYFTFERQEFSLGIRTAEPLVLKLVLENEQLKNERILILIGLIVLILSACSNAQPRNLSIDESYSGKQVVLPVGGVALTIDIRQVSINVTIRLMLKLKGD
jgi:hypothetical protein